MGRSSVRALWILNQHRHAVFSRRFPTVERQWKSACLRFGEEVCHALPSDSQLVQAFMERKEREGSFRGSGIREDNSHEGSDSWVDDPITRSVISLQIPKPDESGSYILWPLVFHIRGAFHILVLPAVEPQHLASYAKLCYREDCGGPAHEQSSISSLLLDSPSITAAFFVAQTLGDLITGEAIEPEINIQPASTMGGLLDSITGGMGIASITARAKPVAAPVAAAATAIAAGVTGAAPTSILGSATRGILKPADKEALLGFITTAMPFGTPLDLNLTTFNAIRQNGFLNQDVPPQDQKQPAWKPYLYKGKQKLLFALHEVVTAAIYDRDDVADVITLKGQLLCRADLEGLPDVTVHISSPRSDSKLHGITYHNCAQALEHSADKHTITFSPPLGNFVLARYLATPSLPPPLQGFYQLSMVSADEGAFLFRMRLLEGYKGPITMEHCSLTIPFQRRKIVGFDGAPSLGVASNGDHSIEWRILVGGRSTISKSMEVTFSGTVKFAPGETSPGDAAGFCSEEDNDLESDEMDKADSTLAAAEWEEPFCWEAYSYAKASVKLVGGTMSGVSVDTKAVAVYPTAKVPCEVSYQIVSGDYIFWNSLGKCPQATTAGE